jgi:hypothetical protein
VSSTTHKAVRPTNLTAALKYAKRGWRVFPLAPGKKTPATAHGFKDATTDPKIVCGWWKKNPNYGIGIATGNSLGVLDLDRPEAEARLETLEREQSVLPETSTVRTARGKHIYFQVPKGLRSRNGIFPGVDFKCEGGYVVAPPSKHPGGTRYEWEQEGRALTQAPIPAWLLEIVQGPSAASSRAVANQYETDFPALVRDGANEGGRNNATASLTGHLLRRRVEPFLTLELVRAWNAVRNQPPLSDSEVMRTVDSIARLELQRRQEGVK